MELCKVCGRMFVTQELLDMHLERYKDRCPDFHVRYDCTKCNFLGICEAHLLLHMQTIDHFEKHLKCHKCRLQLKSKYNYTRHMNRKTPCGNIDRNERVTVDDLDHHYYDTPVRIRAFVEKPDAHTTNRDIIVSIRVRPNSSGKEYLGLIRTAFNMLKKDLGVEGLESAMDELDKIPHVFDKILNHRKEMRIKRAEHYERPKREKKTMYTFEEALEIVDEEERELIALEEERMYYANRALDDIESSIPEQSDFVHKILEGTTKNIFEDE